LSDKEKRVVLSVGEKRKYMCAYKEQYTGASQQNIPNYFSLLWGKPISGIVSEIF
jgi:hypothetical protein